MLAWAVIIEQHDEWEAADRRYFLRVVDARVENHERPDHRGRGGDNAARSHRRLSFNH